MEEVEDPLLPPVFSAPVASDQVADSLLWLFPRRAACCRGAWAAPWAGAQLAAAGLQAELEGGRGVSASLVWWAPLPEGLANGTRFASGPVWA